MDAKELLKEYKRKVDPILSVYFKEKLKETEKLDPLAGQAIRMLEDFALSGGKRIRPALVYYGYLAAGGRRKPAIIEASASIELTHIFLLIHDDIIDKDEKRHGVETIHRRYGKLSRKYFPGKDPIHYGNSMAMLVGDMAAAFGNELIFRSDFPPESIIRALGKMQEIIYRIVPGEMKDVYLEMRGNATEKETLEMYEGKTSSYSFEGPLQLGAVLAGRKDEAFMDALTEYAMPLGKVFQLKDDILGVFGDERKIGKPVGSDIIEGKQTVLVIKALENGSREQARQLKRLLGKKDLDREELETFRRIIRETGSLEYSEQLMDGFVRQSLEALGRLGSKSREASDFLKGIAAYMTERQQ